MVANTVKDNAGLQLTAPASKPQIVQSRTTSKPAIPRRSLPFEGPSDAQESPPLPKKPRRLTQRRSPSNAGNSKDSLAHSPPGGDSERPPKQIHTDDQKAKTYSSKAKRKLTKGITILPNNPNSNIDVNESTIASDVPATVTSIADEYNQAIVRNHRSRSPANPQGPNQTKAMRKTRFSRPQYSVKESVPSRVGNAEGSTITSPTAQTARHKSSTQLVFPNITSQRRTALSEAGDMEMSNGEQYLALAQSVPRSTSKPEDRRFAQSSHSQETPTNPFTTLPEKIQSAEASTLLRLFADLEAKQSELQQEVAQLQQRSVQAPASAPNPVSAQGMLHPLNLLMVQPFAIDNQHMSYMPRPLPFEAQRTSNWGHHPGYIEGHDQGTAYGERPPADQRTGNSILLEIWLSLIFDKANTAGDTPPRTRIGTILVLKGQIWANAMVDSAKIMVANHRGDILIIRGSALENLVEVGIGEEDIPKALGEGHCSDPLTHLLMVITTIAIIGVVDHNPKHLLP